MRKGTLLLAFLLVPYLGTCRRAKMNSVSSDAQNFSASSSESKVKEPDFDTQIKPIFQARCQPCHFQGGKVYDKLPFDRPETINRLGEKLFNRIKDKEEQRIITEFLARP